MDIIILNQPNIDDARRIVENVLNDKTKKDTVFVVEHKKQLWQYIEALELSSGQQLQIKICSELQNLDVFLHYLENPKMQEQEIEIHTFSELLCHLDINTPIDVIVKGDITSDEKKINEVRIQVSEIVQQLIYLNFPLTKIQVMSEKEARDLHAIRLFEEQVQQHIKAIEKSEILLASCPDDNFGYKQQICEHVKNIQKHLENAKINELKIAVAASKKSGKSVVVNSMIKQELAPTSIELATPNNCIYRQAKGKKYTLDFKKEHKEFISGEDMKEYIKGLFKQAETDYANGLTIPDMYIGYPANNSGFLQYVIYDTPGPDIGSTSDQKNGLDVGHKEAARRAVNQADVIVFTIDYSKYLIESELKYLLEIKELFNKKQKNYSLILNINKLDLRYDSEGSDKNIVRILDFIKQRLIALSPEFKSCIVTGTSALTYFNAVAVLNINRLKDCSILLENTGFRDNLDEIIDAYNSQPEMTILSQIDDTVGRARKFHGKRISSLEEIKEFSGMPNMLEYVRYVAVNKARAEKLNHLMFRIEQEYTIIQNLFRFKELEEELMKNKEKLKEALEILKRFHNRIEEIYNNDNEDIYHLKQHNSKKITSDALSKLAEKRPVNLNELSDQYHSQINESIRFDEALNIYTENTLKTRIDHDLDALFSNTQKTRTDKGQKEAQICDVKKIYKENLNSKRIANDISNELKEASISKSKYFEKEAKRIAADLTNLLLIRKDLLKGAVENCKKELNETCEIAFDIKLPRFTPEFQERGKLEKISLKPPANLVENLVEKIDGYSAAKGGGLFARISDWWNNRDEWIFQSDAKKVYEEEEIGNKIRVALWEDVKRTYENTKKTLREQVNQIVHDIIEQMKFSYLTASDACSQVQHILDHTKDYEAYIKQIEETKKQLGILNDCIKPFVESWSPDTENKTQVSKQETYKIEDKEETT